MASSSSSHGDLPKAHDGAITAAASENLSKEMKAFGQPTKKEDDYFHLDGGMSTRPDSKTKANVQYRLYRRRFLGITALVLLNIVAAMNWLAFPAIAIDMTEDFHITLLQVNWLANIVNLIYLPVSIFVPTFITRFGLRAVCIAGAICLLLASWIRYAATAGSLTPGGAYALLFIAQVFTGIAEPIFQVVGPRYSEVWFDLKGRTTATMIVAVANPIGSALGQLIPPLIGNGDSFFAILILGAITSGVLPLVFFIQSAPPIPPTFSGSQPPQEIWDLLRSWVGKKPKSQMTHVMSRTERIDFSIVFAIFSVLVAGTCSFGIFINQIFVPYGFTTDESGIMGAVLFLSGIVAAVLSAPIFDRVLTHHLALSARCLIPILAASWIGLIFAVAPGDYAGIYVVIVLIGVCSFILLPVALELGCEMTRNADASSALLWCGGNLGNFIFVLVQDALRAPETDNPPNNMRRALIFGAVVITVTCASVFFLTGRQARRELDVEKEKEALELSSS